MNAEELGRGLRLGGVMINLMTIVVGMVAAYFLTIQSLKVELAAKAESAMVETLDKRLAGFEVILKQGVVSKEEFYQFSRDIDARLTRIEYYLMDKSGEDLGKR